MKGLDCPRGCVSRVRSCVSTRKNRVWMSRKCVSTSRMSVWIALFWVSSCRLSVSTTPLRAWIARLNGSTCPVSASTTNGCSRMALRLFFKTDGCSEIVFLFFESISLCMTCLNEIIVSICYIHRWILVTIWNRNKWQHWNKTPSKLYVSGTILGWNPARLHAKQPLAKTDTQWKKRSWLF